MASHKNVNRPVRTSTGVLPRPVVDLPLNVPTQDVAAEELVEAESLVEEVSIDGMCGVY
jgi:mycofactocin precursor